MKHLFTSLVFVVLLATIFTCCKHESQEALPACIEQKIQEYKSAIADCNTDSARVTRFDTEIGQVYLFSYQYCCCDNLSPILDEGCNEVCYLDGLLGIQHCMVDSVELALKNPVVVWQK